MPGIADMSWPACGSAAAGALAGAGVTEGEGDGRFPNEDGSAGARACGFLFAGVDLAPGAGFFAGTAGVGMGIVMPPCME
jgi:hypothetical protein